MTRETKLEKLENIIKDAKTFEMDGRQSVVNACKSLYNLIEEDVYNAGCEWMLKGIYNDLCEGNFAEPFMCEQKKEEFAIVVTVYKDKILPRL